MADEKRVTQVSLGCGTLILIALIVLLFGGRGTKELDERIRGLQTDVTELRKTIDNQTGEIRLLQTKLDKLDGRIK